MRSSMQYASTTSHPAAEPLFPDVGVLGLVPDDWDGLWQPRHYVLSRLAEFFRIVWMDPAPYWRHALGADHLRRLITGPAPVPSSAFRIYRPEPWLPLFFRPAALARLATTRRLRGAQRLLPRRDIRKTVLYLWRPHYDTALDLLPHDLSCYHIDDEYTFSTVEQPLDAREARLIARVDQVYIHSAALLEKKGHLNPHTWFVPNGVDYERYVVPYPEPRDLAGIPHPRIGYVGIVKRQLDFDLLLALATEQQDWSFVFVGPSADLRDDAVLAERLFRLPNVHRLGAKTVAQLPAYGQHLDVGMLCYRVDDYTKYIYPLKLHEYLAAGPPVVGTPIRALCDFGHVVGLARTTEEWSEAIARALSPAARSPEQIEARRRVAHRHDWKRLVAMIAGRICEGLGAPYRERFAEAKVGGGLSVP